MGTATRQCGKVFLIGAGPGDPKLLTIRAAEVLAASDVILYDHLVNPQVLAHARRGAELIYAGKRVRAASTSQDSINRFLIRRARRGQLVARLKGGDPFLFGRGGEEAEALAEAGIAWEVVPGISSGTAAPAYAGIPLTHRDHASSVAFITGHDANSNRKERVDWRIAARAADTLVIFMCAETIEKIAREVIASGRPESTPIAIIRWGTYEHQEVLSGTLRDLVSAAESDDSRFAIEPPAIAIIGAVVNLAEKLNWFGLEDLRRPLASSSSPELVRI